MPHESDLSTLYSKMQYNTITTGFGISESKSKFICTAQIFNHWDNGATSNLWVNTVLMAED